MQTLTRLFKAWKWLAAISGIGLLGFLIFSAGLTVGKSQIPVAPVLVEEADRVKMAQPVVTPAPGVIPGCYPPTAKRCQQVVAAQPAGGEFDWGESPQLPGLSSIFAPKPTPIPTGAEKAYRTVCRIPIIGDVVILVATVLGGLGWIIRSLWWMIPLFLFSAVMLGMLVRLPPLAPLIFFWELFQTAMLRRGGKKAREVWKSLLAQRKVGDKDDGGS